MNKNESREQPDVAESVQREIKQMRKEYPEDWDRRYFNNFHSKLPDGYSRTVLTKDIRKPGDAYMDSGRTYKEFFDDIDSAIEELGIDVNELRNDIQKRKYELATKLLIRLIEMGYKRDHFWA